MRFDDYSRLLYSTDASMYQVEPIGVVLPRSKDDVQAVLELANRYNVPVLPRGGGTSLIGQTVNHAVVLDFSKYMNQVLEVNREELWCRVQPGVIQDELNAHVRPMGLLFGPDTSTSNRATIGGMSGNNSAGSHSIAYGKTIDHVLELTCLLADGSEIVLRDLTPAELEAKCRADGLEGQIYREVRRLVGQHAGRDPRAVPEAHAPRLRLQPRRVREAPAVRAPPAGRRLRGHARRRGRDEDAAGPATRSSRPST